jgi:hypothetical protein
MSFQALIASWLSCAAQSFEDLYGSKRACLYFIMEIVEEISSRRLRFQIFAHYGKVRH